MTALIAILTLLLGLVLGVLIGLPVGARRSSTESLDVDRARDLTEAALATALERLAESNARAMQATAERAASDANRQEKTVRDLVNPIDENLRRLTDKLAELERGRSTDSARLETTITHLTELTGSLQQETHTLATAMKDNKVRGNWGELQLKRVVELAGMLEHCDFVTQQHVAGVDGAGRPDLLVKLPQDRTVVVDSKVPMSAYINAINSEDPAARTAYLSDHARDVMAHVDALSRRKYPDLVEGALDFVVMFVPGDTYLAAAFESRPTFFEDAITKGVFPASPGTLIALLRSIAYGWQQDRLTKFAQEIQSLGAEMHDRLVTFSENLDKVGAALTTATKNYNTAVGSLEGRVLVTARRFKEKGVQTAKELESPRQVEEATRNLSAPGLGTTAIDPSD
jgi:DNA recombination protein RmuC